MYNRQLDTFLCVAEEGSFSRAATRLFISPSAVHQQINHLEDHLKVKLLERSPQGIQLTEAGKLLQQEGQKIVQANDLLLRQLQEANHTDIYTIHVGTTLLAKCRLLIELWNNFSADRPDYHLLIKDIGMVMENRKGIDLTEGILMPFFDEEFHFIALSKVPIACAVPVGHRLSEHTQLHWSDLCGETLATIPPDNFPGLNGFLSDAEENSVSLKMIERYDHAVFSNCLLNQTLLQIPLCWRDIVPPGMKVLPCDWKYALPYGFYYTKDPDSPVKSFIRFLERERPEVVFPWAV